MRRRREWAARQRAVVDAVLYLMENPLLQPAVMDDNRHSVDRDRSNSQPGRLLFAACRSDNRTTIYEAPILPISDRHAVSCIVGLFSRRNLTAIIDYYPAGCRMYGRSV